MLPLCVPLQHPFARECAIANVTFVFQFAVPFLHLCVALSVTHGVLIANAEITRKIPNEIEKPNPSQKELPAIRLTLLIKLDCPSCTLRH